MSPEERLRQNVRLVKERIRDACRASGRKPGDLTIVAVTKAQRAELVRELVALGLSDIGESRVQEAMAKKPLLAPGPRWHLVGHLQTNKAKKAIELFDTIHSIDRPAVAEELHRHLQAAGRRLDVFIQVNVSREPRKQGVTPEETLAFFDDIRERCPTLNVLGLMTMAPMSRDPERSRPHFTTLRELAVRCGLRCLSMGMSQDYTVAIEEGATHLRIGRAFFEGVSDAAPGR